MNFELRSDKDRKLIINWDGLQRYISRWKSGTSFQLSIVRKQNTESDPMRRYYFSTVLPITEKTLGYDPEDDLHKWLKIKYFRVKPDDHGIYRERDIPSVFSKESALPVETKWRFVQWVIRKCSEQGGYVPDPRSFGDESMSKTINNQDAWQGLH